MPKLGKAVQKARDIKPRLTGFSTPIFGASWDYADSERDAIRKFITMMEDRRALYDPTQVEIESDVDWSVGKIREYVSECLAAVPEGSKAVEPLRAIRAACRKYLTTKQRSFPNIIPHTGDVGRGAGWLTALGELRGVVGIHIAQLATGFDIDVEDELADIFPLVDEE